MQYLSYNSRQRHFFAILNIAIFGSIDVYKRQISKNAFKKQKKLTKVTIGKNVTKIGANAFYGDKKLSKVTIKGKNLKKIGKNAFKKIKKSATFKVPKGKAKAYKNMLKKAKTSSYKVK